MLGDQCLQHREIPITPQRSRDLFQRTNIAADRPGIHATNRRESELQSDHPLPVLMKSGKVVIFIHVVVKPMPDVSPGPIESIDHGSSIDRVEVDRPEPDHEFLETIPNLVDDRFILPMVAGGRQGLRGREHCRGHPNRLAAATPGDLLTEIIEQVEYHVPIPKRRKPSAEIPSRDPQRFVSLLRNGSLDEVQHRAESFQRLAGPPNRFAPPPDLPRTVRIARVDREAQFVDEHPAELGRHRAVRSDRRRARHPTPTHGASTVSSAIPAIPTTMLTTPLMVMKVIAMRVVPHRRTVACSRTRRIATTIAAARKTPPNAASVR